MHRITYPSTARGHDRGFTAAFGGDPLAAVTVALIAIIVLVLAVTWAVELRRLLADLRARFRDERAIGG